VTPAISVSELTRKYGGIEAVRGIDFEVAAGETFGFLGPNGAGKSTTIKILCTLADPTSGSARVAGHGVVRERDTVRRNIGLVFQETTLFLSGALYPLNGLPSWLTVLTRIDPLTYIVDPMRHAVFGHLPISPVALTALSPGVTWDGRVVPLGLSLAMVAAMGVLMLAIAIAEFRKTE
jgi:ABC transporter/ABC-2 type transporter